MKLKKFSLEFSPVEKINTHVDSTYQHVSFDQMSIMAHQHQATISNTLEWSDPHNPSPLNLDSMCSSMNYDQSTTLT